MVGGASLGRDGSGRCGLGLRVEKVGEPQFREASARMFAEFAKAGIDALPVARLDVPGVELAQFANVVIGVFADDAGGVAFGVLDDLEAVRVRPGAVVPGVLGGIDLEPAVAGRAVVEVVGVPVAEGVEGGLAYGHGGVPCAGKGRGGPAGKEVCGGQAVSMAIGPKVKRPCAQPTSNGRSNVWKCPCCTYWKPTWRSGTQQMRPLSHGDQAEVGREGAVAAERGHGEGGGRP